jgi:spoIIIJ-associated protein
MSTDAETKSNAKELLDTMLGYLGFVVEIEETRGESGNPTLQIYTEEADRLIGRDGDTLDAVQFLLNRLLQAKNPDAPKWIVDCEMYRSMCQDRIVHHVRQLAERVRISGRPLQLEPMNSYERRIVTKRSRMTRKWRHGAPRIRRGSSRSRCSDVPRRKNRQPTEKA